MNEYRKPYPNELYHYGVKGMRWGIINEDELVGRKPGKNKTSNPAHSRAFSNAARQKARSFIKNKKVSDFKRAFEVATQKTADAALDMLSVGLIGSVVAGAIRKKQFATERANATQVDKNGLKLQTPPPKTTKENLVRSNPNYFTRKMEYVANCTNCSMTFEARERGYEVEAQPIVNRDVNETINVLQEAYPGAEPVHIVKEPRFDHPDGWPSTIEELYEYEHELYNINLSNGDNNEKLIEKVKQAFAKEPVGSRGQLLVTWKTGGGHALNYEIDKNHKLVILDPQVNKRYKGIQAEHFLSRLNTITYTRLDNCEINAEALKERNVLK